MGDGFEGVAAVRAELERDVAGACAKVGDRLREQAESLQVAGTGSRRGECHEAARMLLASCDELTRAAALCRDACADLAAYVAWAKGV